MHDQLFAKGGIAASSSHHLRQSVERHKARLQAEFTKARLRRRCGSVAILKEVLNTEKLSNGASHALHPRWARINTLRASLQHERLDTFASWNGGSLAEVMNPQTNSLVLAEDPTVPNLIAVPSSFQLSKTEAYSNGRIILQDKASCFPAHLLLGSRSQPGPDIGDVMDACAAPGNKTTHLAAILSSYDSHAGKSLGRTRIFACERDAARSETLRSMVQKAGAESVTVLAKQDFLSLDPSDHRFTNVTHLLLDPSCSGSGILGREDVPVLVLPRDPRQKANGDTSAPMPSRNSKKGKRVEGRDAAVIAGVDDHADTMSEEVPQSVDRSRLEKLASLQSRIIEHAFRFPAASMITYSTCSIHVEENEAVVARVLSSNIGQQRGWRVLRREEQVAGLMEWKCRGVDSVSESPLTMEQLDACIRCYPANGEGTMGFFVCCFTRGAEQAASVTNDLTSQQKLNATAKDDDDDWHGFSDDDS